MDEDGMTVRANTNGTVTIDFRLQGRRRRVVLPCVLAVALANSLLRKCGDCYEQKPFETQHLDLIDAAVARLRGVRPQ